MTDLEEVKKLTVIRLIDDDVQFLDSMEMMLTMKGWNVRKYSNAESFLKVELFRDPGCIVLDMRMPELTGIELQEKLAQIKGQILPIIFLTAHGDVESAVHTLKHGAHDFFQKPVRPSIFIAAIEAAAQKSIEELAFKKESDFAKKAFFSLTPREKEVFKLAALGKSNKEISITLGIAVPTVKMHRSKAFDKLGIHSSTEAANLLKDYDLNN